MTQTIPLPPALETDPVPAPDRPGTTALLAGGAVAGPLFIAVALIQAFTRAGFDPRRHPLSLLSLGDLGWVQITNFVVAGLLFVVGALGLRRVLHPGRGGTWGPWLIGVFGVSLVAGGVFVADPGLGFPPGAPAGVPDQLSWHGLLHAVAPVTGFLSLIAAFFVLARRFAAMNHRGWAVACGVIGLVTLTLSAWPNPTENFLPLWGAMILGFGWASAIAARLMRATP